MTFEDEVGVSDLDSGGSTVAWYKPPQSTAQSYINGFSTDVTILGSYYADPTADYPLDLQTLAGGNALVTLGGGDLTSQLQNLINIPQFPTAAATLVSGSADSITETATPATGAIKGKFTPPGTTKSISYTGVYFQKQNLGLGFFNDSTESGSVNITPQ